MATRARVPRGPSQGTTGRSRVLARGVDRADHAPGEAVALQRVDRGSQGPAGTGVWRRAPDGERRLRAGTRGAGGAYRPRGPRDRDRPRDTRVRAAPAHVAAPRRRNLARRITSEREAGFEKRDERGRREALRLTDDVDDRVAPLGYLQ